MVGLAPAMMAQSLGDWDIDPRKYPNGLKPLIAKVNEHGMSFGIWFEPEMINPNSDLYRRHPEWVLGPLDQQGVASWFQDMANAEVRDYLFGKISNAVQSQCQLSNGITTVCCPM